MVLALYAAILVSSVHRFWATAYCRSNKICVA